MKTKLEAQDMAGLSDQRLLGSLMHNLGLELQRNEEGKGWLARNRK